MRVHEQLISDANEGLKHALGKVLGVASWQRAHTAPAALLSMVMNGGRAARLEAGRGAVTGRQLQAVGLFHVEERWCMGQ